MTLASGIMGMRIGLEGSLGMSLGSKSGGLLARAARLAPDNPRVHLQQGISSFNTPEMWGGSKKDAEAALRTAVSLFAGQSDAAAWPDWGYLDALAWLGQTLTSLDKIDEARAVYQQALAIDPEMGWIRYDLLPGLDAAQEK
jgi:tetratricopeptide (TPR) repeat protein